MGIIISICTLLVIYFGMTIYFMNHFYFGTAINCISASGKTVEEVNQEIPANLKTYKLTLKERGGKTEEIKAEDINLTYNPNKEVQNLKNTQNPLKWVFAFWSKQDAEITEEISYDEKLLKERIDGLSCVNSSDVTEPRNPSFKYTDNSYVIVNEVIGNKINKDVLFDYLSSAVLNMETTVDLEAASCYVNPQYTSNSEKVTDTKNLLNKYVSSKFTYTFGDKKEIIDGSIINKWLKVDENLKVTLDEEQVKIYINSLSHAYDTVGRTRNFVASSGKTIKVRGGDYGFKINTSKEKNELITAIKEGKTGSKKPAYIQTAFSYGDNDIGNTYVEINISKQHLWFYKNGSLIAEGNVVTGNAGNHATPTGVYSVKYKERNAVLEGLGYSSPVDYWMPFNKGIGLHDASWRSYFGGSIYKTNGSHGCVNLPYSLAKTIFNNIQPGTPVVCYN